MRTVFVIILLVLSISISCKGERKEEVKNNEKETLYADLNGVPVSLEQFKGKRILVNYWATWCGPCLKEMPGLKRAEEVLKKHNYTFILVSDETISKIATFKKVKNYDFTFLKSIESNETLGIYSLPTSYIFDEKGNKLETIIGTIAWDSEEIINKLKTL